MLVTSDTSIIFQTSKQKQLALPLILEVILEVIQQNFFLELDVFVKKILFQIHARRFLLVNSDKSISYVSFMVYFMDELLS